MPASIIRSAIAALGLAPPPPSPTTLAAELFNVDIADLDQNRADHLLEALERIALAARPTWAEPYVHKPDGRLPPHLRHLRNVADEDSGLHA